MSSKPTDHLPASADWGEGVTRRALRIRGMPGRVEAALEDMRHAMICTVEHDGEVVTAVEADFRRYSLQLCPGASVPLKQIVGLPLSTSTAAFFANGRARQNCTHMLDLAWLAMRHADRGEAECLYEVAVPDSLSGPMRGTLHRNGELVQDWIVQDSIIVSPSSLSGQPLYGGFTRWLTAAANLPDLVVEECLILHKGFFMTGARQFAIPEGELADDYKRAVAGACYGYSPERIDEATGMTGMARDFSHAPEKLLRFE